MWVGLVHARLSPRVSGCRNDPTVPAPENQVSLSSPAPGPLSCPHFFLCTSLTLCLCLSVPHSLCVCVSLSLKAMFLLRAALGIVSQWILTNAQRHLATITGLYDMVSHLKHLFCSARSSLPLSLQLPGNHKSFTVYDFASS